MVSQEIQELIALIKSGKYWHQDINEGFIDVYYKDGIFIRQEFQINPYSGERRNETIEMKESDFTFYFSSLNVEEVMKNVIK